MNIATLINALKTSYPKIWRRIQVLSRQKKMSIPATLINCLEGETTQRGNDATLKKGGVFTRPKGETTQRKGA